MREIKFRGMATDGKWVYGLLSYSTGARGLPEKGWFISNTHGMPWAFLIRPETRGQYTGLKDKNKKEIYGGDIFQVGSNKEWIKGEGERSVVEWHNKLARFGLSFYSIYGGEGYTGKEQHLVDCIRGLKVIGNKYENPELLEKEK